MRRLLYTLASPFILLGEMAAAAGDVVRDFPREFRNRWRALSVPAPKWPEDAERIDPLIPRCTECLGSGHEPGVHDLDGDPACSRCGGTGDEPMPVIEFVSEEERRRVDAETLRCAVEAMERKKRI